jgi:hypothetical protein
MAAFGLQEGTHFGHHIIVWHAGAWIVETALDALAEPAVIAVCLLLGLKLAHNWV